jgi:hypothetical protein
MCSSSDTVTMIQIKSGAPPPDFAPERRRALQR